MQWWFSGLLRLLIVQFGQISCTASATFALVSVRGFSVCGVTMSRTGEWNKWLYPEKQFLSWFSLQHMVSTSFLAVFWFERLIITSLKVVAIASYCFHGRKIYFCKRLWNHRF